MRGVLVAVLSGTVLLAGCGSAGPGKSGGSGGSASASAVPATIAVRSSAFTDGGSIPTRYTCDGAGDVPPLRWSSVPGTARALALFVDDPDAPGGTFTHWVVLDLPPDTTSVRPEQLSTAAVQGSNSAGSTGWTPPCPPEGDPHHYRFTVYALDADTGLPKGTAPTSALSAIEAHAIARGRLTGTYTRH
ncbi:MAG TPA: YbhB/YbcL family Raf kinase inhibitor-like protein [Mycobacterium sp.]|nr:YbhB/YbcL family Raf kinase inhibitor-like protein [Mycobacterium sp.]